MSIIHSLTVHYRTSSAPSQAGSSLGANLVYSPNCKPYKLKIVYFKLLI